MLRTFFLVLATCFSFAACSPEQSAKVAHLIGERTLLEKEGDQYGRMALETFSKAIQTSKTSKDSAIKQFDEAVAELNEANKRYEKDCGAGNRNSCHKLDELQKKWHELYQVAKETQ